MKNVRMMLNTVTLMVVFVGFSTLSNAQSSEATNGRIQKDTTVTRIWCNPETPPAFPGGVQKLKEFLANNTHYPEECKKDSIEGRVVLNFMIEENGEISDIKVVKGVHPAMDKEAVRVVRMMPKWCPGKMNGQARRVRYKFTFTFRLP